jgi:hypothetical protein
MYLGAIGSRRRACGGRLLSLLRLLLLLWRLLLLRRLRLLLLGLEVELLCILLRRLLRRLHVLHLHTQRRRSRRGLQWVSTAACIFKVLAANPCR